MRPRSAYTDSSQSRSFHSEFNSSNTSSKVERPGSSFSTRSRVLKSASTAYQSWLRRSTDNNSGISFHPREYKSVQTFNLRSGCQVTKSSSQLQVKIDPDEFFDPKIKPKEVPPMKTKDMEMLIRNLQEQVKYLSLSLEEEQLHHAGSKKRAMVDVERTKKEMQKEQSDEIERVLKNHMEFIEDMKKEHAQQMQELEEELKKQYGKLENEYRMLQASFKNYRSKISDEMGDKWREKEKDFEFEKQKAVENAVDNMRRVMEERFSTERAEIRTEYKQSMQELVNEQTREMEEFMRKMGDGKLSVEELKKKADRVDSLEEMLSDMKEKFQTTSKELKKTQKELGETQANLSVYEHKFEEKVGVVEDKYRKRIDDLVQELADIRVKLINKAETLYHERFESEELQKKHLQYIKDNIKEKLKAQLHNRETVEDNSSSTVILTEQKKDPNESGNITGGGDNLNTSSSPLQKDKISIPYSNGIRVSFKNIVLDEDHQNTKTFSLPPRKFKSKKSEDCCENHKSDDLVALTIAGPDKVRPYVPMTTVSLLDTANLPYLEDTNKLNNSEVKSDQNPSRPQSPDVIF